MFGMVVKDLHIELTSRCTLGCPRCQRNSDPDELSVQDLPLETIKATITRAHFPDVAFLNLCGNYGDPIYHRDFHAVIAHFKAEGFVVRFDTNGSYRPRDWWRKTAALLTRKDRVSFSIDGLEDTYGIYRVNARWPDIMDAVEELRGKTRLVWKFIVFRHNQHQVAEAEARAKALGFDEMKIIRSNRFGGRFAGPDGVDPMQPDDEWVSDRVRVARQIVEIAHGRPQGRH